ncbi:Prolamin-like domain [Arabidopsis suecica]|uniref:Prolamin-like domain n=1 Tax=Arabidopsis suecica TaxID=45249 RepID=A0A8T2DPG4_ARASU|nr:Prolamin-like domain [Arabidopsis suecica]
MQTPPTTVPGIFPPGLPIDLVKCWSSLFNVEGCVLEIAKSIFSGKFENVEAACCKAFSTLDANCWPHMFPLNPFFPPLPRIAALVLSPTPLHTTKSKNGC